MLKMMSVVLTGAALLAAAMTASPAAAQAGKASQATQVKVTPSAGLAGGDTVRVTATGITPGASVQVIQCREPDGDPADVCSPTLTTTASGSGHVSVKLTLVDPAWEAQEIGDSVPVYCRADHCHVFLDWTDGDGHPQTLSSPRLWFKGSPATISASQTSNLHGGQLVAVSGTAYGAQGHKFMVLEESCYRVSQGSGCYGQLPPVDGVIGKNGKYLVHYRVRQHLSDGSDCNDQNMIGLCELSVVILTKGKPDDSFGVSDIGQPLVLISFLGSGQRPAPRS